jgi:hypothetical protein
MKNIYKCGLRPVENDKTNADLLMTALIVITQYMDGIKIINLTMK